MESSELLVVEDCDGIDDIDELTDDRTSVFVIREAFKSVSGGDLERRYDEISGLALQDPYLANVYEMTSQKFAKPGPYSLLVATVLYELVEEEVVNTDVERITTHGLPDIYNASMRDLAANHEIKVDISSGLEPTTSLLSGSKQLIAVLLFAIDQLVGMLYGLLFSTKGAEHVLFPTAHEDVVPVVRELENRNEDFCLIYRKPVLYWIKRRLAILVGTRGSNEDIYDQYPTTPLNTFATPGTLLRELKLLYVLAVYLVLGNRFSDVIRQALAGRLGFDLGYTVSAALENLGVSGNLFGIRHPILIEELIEGDRIENVIVGSLGAWGIGALQSVRSSDVDGFHLPHGIVTQYYPNVYPATQFVTNEIEVSYLRNTTTRFEESNLCPAGRPKLDEFVEGERTRDPKLRSKNSDISTVLIATRPFDNRIREQFVRDIVSSVDDDGIQFLIKTHPRENSIMYEQIVRSAEQKIELRTDRLYESIRESDVIITSNSNVGFEAVILGTPCIVYNKWSPRIRNLPIYEMVDVPITTDRSELSQKLDEFRCDSEIRVQSDQITSYIAGGRTSDCSSVKRIVDRIVA